MTAMQTISTEELDRRFDEGEDLEECFDMANPVVRKPDDIRRVNFNMPGWLVDAIDNEGIQKFYVSFKFAPNMELSAILGLYHHGETTRETEATQFGPGTSIDRADDYTQIQIGVGFDYYFMQVVLPLSIGGEFLISHWGEDNNQFTLNALAGVHANLVGGLYLTGKVGLGFDYFDREGVEAGVNYEDTRLDVGFKASAILSWYFM